MFGGLVQDLSYGIFIMKTMFFGKIHFTARNLLLSLLMSALNLFLDFFIFITFEIRYSNKRVYIRS